MASRDIYERTFDEDVQQNDHTTCPECDGRVTTNAHETVCNDCGLVVEDEAIDHGPEWRRFDTDERERTGAPLTAARHDRGLSTEIGREADANDNDLPDRSDADWPGCGGSNLVGDFNRKLNETLHMGLVKSAGS